MLYAIVYNNNFCMIISLCLRKNDSFQNISEQRLVSKYHWKQWRFKTSERNDLFRKNHWKLSLFKISGKNELFQNIIENGKVSKWDKTAFPSLKIREKLAVFYARAMKKIFLNILHGKDLPCRIVNTYTIPEFLQHFYV